MSDTKCPTRPKHVLRTSESPFDGLIPLGYNDANLFAEHLIIRGTMAQEKKEAVKTKRPTAVKRDIQNQKRREQNRVVKSQIKTAIRHFEETLNEGDSTARAERLNQAYRLLDKGHKKGVVPANAASRTKSRLAAKLAAKG